MRNNIEIQEKEGDGTSNFAISACENIVDQSASAWLSRVQSGRSRSRRARTRQRAAAKSAMAVAVEDKMEPDAELAKGVQEAVKEPDQKVVMLMVRGPGDQEVQA